MDWKLKVDENNVPVFDKGKPVYLDPDGKELALDAPALYQKVTDLGKENKTHREKHQELQKKFEIFNGIEDIADWHSKATSALETVANFNQNDWIKASKVEDFKNKIKQDYEEKLTSKDKAIADLQKEYGTVLSEKDQKIRNLMVSSKFSSSKYFVGDGKVTTLTPEIAESFFGKNFKVEDVDGKLTLRAYYSNGDVVLSKQDPGEPAGFEEAIGFIIDAYPGKDSILATGKSGSGGSGGSGGGAGATDELSTLQKQYEEATKSGNTRLAIALKNKIHAAKMKLKNG